MMNIYNDNIHIGTFRKDIRVPLVVMHVAT